MPPESADLIEELEQAFALGTPQTRMAALWHTTDLLLTGRYSDDQLWVFGEVIERLAVNLESEARAKLADRLSRCASAPAQIVRKFASDNAIEIAGPMLRNSERLSDQSLIEFARSKGQPHLLAITQRRSLSEAVTDVIVTRGNRDVVRSVARNEGARFSDTGFWHLVKRSEGDSILLEDVGMRKDIPRHHFLKLVSKASEEVRRRLVAIAPEAKADIEHIVADVAGAAQAKVGPGSRDYFAAKKRLTGLHHSGGLGAREFYDIVRSKNFEETTVALSLLCELPVDAVERALIQDRPEMALILGKAAGLPWKCVHALLFLRAGGSGLAQQDLDAAQDKFSRLTTEAARQVIGFYQERRKAAAT